jgi:hypothetical protein
VAEKKKSGWKTSEYWVTVGTLGSLFVAQATGHQPEPIVAGAGAAIAAVYNVVRLFTKKTVE